MDVFLKKLECIEQIQKSKLSVNIKKIIYISFVSDYKLYYVSAEENLLIVINYVHSERTQCVRYICFYGMRPY